MKRVTCDILLLVFCTCLAATANAGELKWERLPSAQTNVTAASIGVSGNALLLVTGSSDRILAQRLSGDQAGWFEAGRLETRSDFGAVNVGDRMVLVGGRDAAGLVADVTAIRLDPASSKVSIEVLPPLPEPIAKPVMAALGQTLFVLSSQKLWSLDLANKNPDWRGLAIPGDASFKPLIAAAQRDGESFQLYLFGSEQAGWAARSYNPRSGQWRRVANAPFDLTDAVALPSGQAHIQVFTPERILSFHTITGTWTQGAPLPPEIAPAAATQAGATAFVLSKDGSVWSVKPPALQSRFRLLDYIALAAYPLLLLAMGFAFRVKEKNLDEYFRGGQRIPWWAAGLSLVATQVSAIGFMAIPAKAFATDWVYLTGVLGWFVVVPVVTHVYIPLFRRLNVTTAYEYLEARFNFSVRIFSSVMFMLMQVTRAAVVLYLPAIALSSVTGVDKLWCIGAMGIITTTYTVLGGMNAVIWTDVVQAGTLLVGALLCVGLAMHGAGGIGNFVEIAWNDRKFDVISPGWSMSSPALWLVLSGSVFARLAALTSDQNVVQRYQTTRNAREASRALWTDAAVSIPWALIVFLLGTSLYVFFKTHPEMLDPAMETDQVVPLFIARAVPQGLAGLIVAAIFAASLDGTMLSVATVFVRDLYCRYRPLPERSQVNWARAVTIALGAFATCIALLLATANIGSLWDFFIQMSGLCAGALAGVFVLGLFTKRVGSAAAFVGVFASAILMYFVESHKLVHGLFYAAVGVISSVVAGLLASLVFPGRSDSLEGLTIYTVPQIRTPSVGNDQQSSNHGVAIDSSV